LIDQIYGKNVFFIYGNFGIYGNHGNFVG